MRRFNTRFSTQHLPRINGGPTVVPPPPPPRGAGQRGAETSSDTQADAAGLRLPQGGLLQSILCATAPRCGAHLGCRCAVLHARLERRLCLRQLCVSRGTRASMCVTKWAAAGAAVFVGGRREGQRRNFGGGQSTVERWI